MRTSRIAPVLGVLFAVVRLQAQTPDFSRVPGVIINHIPAAEGRYVGSPSLAILPDGAYVASHDEFGPKSHSGVAATSHIFRSEDKGATWKCVATINPAFWSNLFVHRGALYLMGTSKEYGDLLIRRSTDGGHTWTEPLDATSGLLSRGAYHTAPMPVIEHNGRIWRSFEDASSPAGWGEKFKAFVMSAPVDADLLRADSWQFTNMLARDPKWLDGTFRGWLEGNAVVTPRGAIVDMLRVDYRPGPELAAVVRISKDGKSASFRPARDFIRFPGGAKKFVIRHDDQSRRYWALATPRLDKHADVDAAKARNALAVMSSRDLRKWTIHDIVLYHPDIETHAFQYPDWLFDGDDIAVVSRTAYEDGLGGAPRAHDANFMTFHRIEDFRALAEKKIDPPRR